MKWIVCTSLVFLLLVTACTTQVSFTNYELNELPENDSAKLLYDNSNIAGEAYKDLTSEQKRSFWSCWRNSCYDLYKDARVSGQWGDYSICSKGCFAQAESITMDSCQDSDNMDYLNKGTLTTNKPMSGSQYDCKKVGNSYVCSDSCYTFSNGKEYLFEMQCRGTNPSAIQKNCKELGADYSCKDGRCVEVLDPLRPLKEFESLVDVKNKLENMEVNLNFYPGIEPTGLIVVNKLLSEGYDGFFSYDEMDDFLEDKLSPYFLDSGRGWDQKEYILSVVHSLWIENNQIVPWSLADYSKDEIESLFWVNDLGQEAVPKTTADLTIDYSVDQAEFESHGQTTLKLFPIAFRHKTQNQELTIDNLIKWQKKNFFHSYYDYGWDVYQDDQPKIYGVNMIPPTSIERLFDERVTGCHLNDIVFSGLLRSLNIPASKLTFEGHGITYLPTLNKYVHGDHFADFALIPSENFLLTTQDINSLRGQPIRYTEVFNELYPYPRHYFTNIELHRKGNSLILETNSVCGVIPDTDWAILQSQVPEFNLKYDEENCKIYSDEVPIKSLRELSVFP